MQEYGILFRGPLVRALLSGEKTETRRLVSPQPKVSANGCPSWGYDEDEKGRRPRIPNGPRFTCGGRAVTMTDLIGEYCPWGAPGDRLWCREAFQRVGGESIETADVLYRADMSRERLEWIHSQGEAWTPGIHMKRDACRLLLDLGSVRVERLRDIDEAGAMREGMLTLSFADLLEMAPSRRRVQMIAVDFGLEDVEDIPWASAATIYRNCYAYLEHIWPELPTLDRFRIVIDAISGPGTWDLNPWVWVLADLKRVV